MDKYLGAGVDDVPDEKPMPKLNKRKVPVKPDTVNEESPNLKERGGLFQIAMDNYKIVLGVIVIIVIASLVIIVFFTYKPKEDQKKLQEYASGVLPNYYNAEQVPNTDLEELMEHQRMLNTAQVPQPPTTVIQMPSAPVEQHINSVLPEPPVLAPAPAPTTSPEPPAQIPAPAPEPSGVRFAETTTVKTYEPENPVSETPNSIPVAPNSSNPVQFSID